MWSAGVTGPEGTPADKPLLMCEGLTKIYPASGRRSPDQPTALSQAAVKISPGECLGIVGESGSGKTTLANCLAGLLKPSAGTVTYQGEVIAAPGISRPFPRVRGIQIVFQDPASSLNPRRNVGSVLAEIIRVHALRPRDAVRTRVRELFGLVGLDYALTSRRPRRLSGGQQQLVAIARALAFEPRLMIADEIVSALDASVQAQILNLLADLREHLGLAIILITHDMSVARHLCDQIVVMQAGQIVEDGPVDRVLQAPEHPDTQELLSAVPRLDSGAPPAASGRWG